jgi:hypothetical protein
MATKQEIREYFARFGKQGGKARAKNMTREQRAESARKASQARWQKLEASMDEVTKNLAKLRKVARARQKKAGVGP